MLYILIQQQLTDSFQKHKHPGIALQITDNCQLGDSRPEPYILFLQYFVGLEGEGGGQGHVGFEETDEVGDVRACGRDWG